VIASGRRPLAVHPGTLVLQLQIVIIVRPTSRKFDETPVRGPLGREFGFCRVSSAHRECCRTASRDRGSGQPEDAGGVLVQHLVQDIGWQAKAIQADEAAFRREERKVAAPQELPGQPSP